MLKKAALFCTVATLSLTPPVLAKDLRTVGITVGSLGNPFFVQLAKGAEAKALGGGKVNATAVSADYDLNKQSTQIDNFIASGAEIVLIDAVDPNAIEPAINRLHDAGIVAVAVDESAKGADITIQTNNVEAGQKSCQYIADKLDGKGNVVIMDGPPVSSVFARVDGCKAVFAKYPGIKILSDNQNGKGSREG